MTKKSGKRKSSKKLNTGTTLGVLALIISIVALGLGVYQFITPPASEGPTFYILEHDDIIYLDKYSSIDYVNELNITYNTEVGDTVVLEFSCRIFLDVVSTMTTLYVYFQNNGSTSSPSIVVRDVVDTMTTGYMRYTFEASTAGENYLVIYTYCSQEVDNNLRDSLLTVTVYG